MRLALTAALLLLLAGCVAANVQTYAGTPRPDSEVATLEFRGAFLAYRGNAHAGLSSVDGVQYGKRSSGYPKSAKVLPGRHKVVVFCTVAQLEAFPEITIEVEAGQSYEISCTDDGSGYARAKFGPATAKQ